MKKVTILVGLIIALFAYFFMTLVIFPQEYLSHQVINPQPTHTVKLSDDKITLGKSFVIKIDAENKNDVADILITSVAFPRMKKFSRSPAPLQELQVS